MPDLVRLIGLVKIAALSSGTLMVLCTQLKPSQSLHTLTSHLWKLLDKCFLMLRFSTERHGDAAPAGVPRQVKTASSSAAIRPMTQNDSNIIKLLKI